MGRNLARSPLVALLYASLLYFTAVFLPFSEQYRQIFVPFTQDMGLSGYLMLLVYCLFVSVLAAVAFSVAGKAGFGAVIALLPVFLGFQWIIPFGSQLFFGETTGVMSVQDTLMRLIQGCVGTIVLLLLCMLLFAPKAAETQKHNLKMRNLLIFFLVLPVIYCVLYFLLGYFLCWTSGAVRAYYSGGEDHGFLDMLITMLLQRPDYAGFALLKGFVLALFSLPLMLFPHLKRIFFTALNVMFYLSGALLFLLPSPLMPDDVRITHLITDSVIMVTYGALAGVLLHTCFKEEAPATGRQPADKTEKPSAKNSEPAPSNVAAKSAKPQKR